MNDEALKSAFGSLKLKDIILHEARFSRPTAPPAEVEAMVRAKRIVQFGRADAAESGAPTDLLQVMVALGVRVTGKEGDDAPVYVEIEADFLAEYEIVAEITEESIKAFASFNAVHNVWPFWRQHVFDVVQRARLSPIEVPLFSG